MEPSPPPFSHEFLYLTPQATATLVMEASSYSYRYRIESSEKGAADTLSWDTKLAYEYDGLNSCGDATTGKGALYAIQYSMVLVLMISILLLLSVMNI